MKNKKMKKASIIYEEKRILSAKFNHPQSDDYLNYESTIRGMVTIRENIAVAEFNDIF